MYLNVVGVTPLRNVFRLPVYRNLGVVDVPGSPGGTCAKFGFSSSGFEFLRYGVIHGNKFTGPVTFSVTGKNVVGRLPGREKPNLTKR